MNTVYIKNILNYKSKDEIQNFVHHALVSNNNIMDLLSNSRDDRLIVLKPNWVQESHEQKPDVWEPLITHPTIIISVIECLGQLIKGHATISICDGPHTYASFAKIIARGDFDQHLKSLRIKYPNLTLELLDLRREIWLRREEVIIERKANPDDPRGYVATNLGNNSLFYRFHGEGRYYGAYVDTREVNAHHHGETHEYLIAGTPMSCDLFINLPKMKTHKKTGITCCLKNLVGINGDKNWLPHHVEGTPKTNGDEFPTEKISHSFERYAKKKGQQLVIKYPFLFSWLLQKLRNIGKTVIGDSDTTIRNGNWEGNDTCWRMVHDLNKAMLFYNKDGSLREKNQPRLYLAIVDGIIGGEGNGPLCPDAVESNILVSGTNPATVDLVVSCLMGFNPYKLALVFKAFLQGSMLPIANCHIEDVIVHDLDRNTNLRALDIPPAVASGFKPHFGWPNILIK